MKNIENYKTRFYALMESTMGDVKPLISEAPQYEEFVTPTIDMVIDTKSSSLIDGNYNPIKNTLSLNGNEYKMTLNEGMYNPNETIAVLFNMNNKLNFVGFHNKDEGIRVVNYNGHGDKNDDYSSISWYINMPMTQEEFETNSPYIKYLDVSCKNVRGGKIRFSVEVPSGSEIFKTETP
jgi:hypothetical protein